MDLKINKNEILDCYEKIEEYEQEKNDILEKVKRHSKTLESQLLDIEQKYILA